MKPVLFLLILSSFSIHAQVKILPIKYKVDDDSLSFPLIKYTNKSIANKINLYLQNELLENSKIETDPKKIFDSSRYIHTDSMWSGWITWMEYSIAVNNSKVLSLQFHYESMTAYPESHDIYYSFDLRTGEQIQSRQLFTTAGLTSLKKKLIIQRKKLIDRETSERINDPSDAEYLNDTAFVREKFTECNESADEANVFIKEGSVLFYKDYCFPHVTRAYDTDLNIEFSFKQLEKCFTPYARELLFAPKKLSSKN